MVQRNPSQRRACIRCVQGLSQCPAFRGAVTDPLKSFVLRVTINSSIFNSLLHSAQLGSHSGAFIINRQGALQTPSLLDRKELTTAEQALISCDSLTETKVTVSDIYATRIIGNGNWLLVLKANINDSRLGYYLTVRDRILLIIVIIIALASIAAIVVSILLTRNMERADKEHAAHSLQFAHVEKMATICLLAAGIAHEINNPLQIIASNAGWMAELLPEEDPKTVKNLEEYTRSVTQIRHHVKRAGNITNRLLGYSHKVAAQNKKADINELISETLSLVERQAENKKSGGCSLSFAFAGDHTGQSGLKAGDIYHSNFIQGASL